MAVQGLSTTLHRILLAGENRNPVYVMLSSLILQIGYNSYEETLASLHSEFAQHQQCPSPTASPVRLHDSSRHLCRWLRETVRDTRGNSDSVGLVCPPTMRKSNRKTEGRRTAKSIFENDPDDKENTDAQQTPSKDIFDFKATPGASGKKGLAVNQSEAKRRTSSAAGNHLSLEEFLKDLTCDVQVRAQNEVVNPSKQRLLRRTGQALLRHLRLL